MSKSPKRRESDRRKGVCLKVSSRSRGRARWREVRTARKLETRTQALCVSFSLEFCAFAQAIATTLTGEKNERKRGRETEKKEERGRALIEIDGICHSLYPGMIVLETRLTNRVRCDRSTARRMCSDGPSRAESSRTQRVWPSPFLIIHNITPIIP